MGNFYNITTKYDNAIYERGEANYYVVKIKDIDASTHIDPSTVSLTIYDPCLAKKVSDIAMIKDTTGVYYYSYAIPADATYGMYEIEVTASSPTYTTKYKDKFFILPWNVIYDVKKYSGISSNKSISDHDIAAIIWEAYQEALDSVYESWHDDKPLCNPDDGSWFDGTNTTFATRHGSIADINGDGVVTGWGEISCGTDIDGWWKDVNGDCHRVNVTVNDAKCGKITITQTDGTAIPNSMQWVHLDYHTEWETYSEDLFKIAVSYLSAYKCIVRFRELTRSTMADLHSNKVTILHSKSKTLWDEYRKILRKIMKPMIGGTMLPGES